MDERGDIFKLMATSHPKGKSASRLPDSPLSLDNIILVQAPILDRVLSSVDLRKLELAIFFVAIDIELANYVPPLPMDGPIFDFEEVELHVETFSELSVVAVPLLHY